MPVRKLMKLFKMSLCSLSVIIFLLLNIILITVDTKYHLNHKIPHPAQNCINCGNALNSSIALISLKVLTTSQVAAVCGTSTKTCTWSGHHFKSLNVVIDFSVISVSIFPLHYLLIPEI